MASVMNVLIVFGWILVCRTMRHVRDCPHMEASHHLYLSCPYPTKCIACKYVQLFIKGVTETYPYLASEKHFDEDGILNFEVGNLFKDHL